MTDEAPMTKALHKTASMRDRKRTVKVLNHTSPILLGSPVSRSASQLDPGGENGRPETTDEETGIHGGARQPVSTA
jgi:hypothetical protein